MACGDKTITFSEQEVDALQSILTEFWSSSEAHLSPTMEILTRGLREKLALTPSSLT